MSSSMRIEGSFDNVRKKTIAKHWLAEMLDLLADAEASVRSVRADIDGPLLELKVEVLTNSSNTLSWPRELDVASK